MSHLKKERNEYRIPNTGNTICIRVFFCVQLSMRECQNCQIFMQKSPEGRVLEWLEIFLPLPQIVACFEMENGFNHIYLFIYISVLQYISVFEGKGNLTFVGGPLNANVAVVALVMLPETTIYASFELHSMPYFVSLVHCLTTALSVDRRFLKYFFCALSTYFSGFADSSRFKHYHQRVLY